MSHRREQIESTMRRAVSQVLLGDLSDPRIRGMMSVTRVKLSEDMRTLNVWLTVLPAKYESRTVAGLRAAVGHIHRRICDLVDLRTVPHLRFEIDSEMHKQESIYDAISRGLGREGLSSTDVKHIVDPASAALAATAGALDDADGDEPEDQLEVDERRPTGGDDHPSPEV